MAHDIQLPCDGNGVCMQCKAKPQPEEILTCATCVTPWHVSCLSSPPETLASTLQWHCPDCSGDVDPLPPAACVGFGASDGGIVAAIRAIEEDESLTEREKAKKRQVLMSGKVVGDDDDDEDEEKKKKEKDAEMGNDVFVSLGENLNCSFCLQLPERPVTVCSRCL